MKSIEKKILAECEELLNKQGHHMPEDIRDVIKHAVDRTIFIVKQEAMTRINKI